MLSLFSDSYDPDRPRPWRAMVLVMLLAGAAWIAQPLFVFNSTYQNLMSAAERSMWLGMEGRAVAYARRAAEADPGQRLPYVYIGLGLERGGNLDEAARAYRLAWPAMRGCPSGDPAFERITEAYDNWQSLQDSGW